MSTPLGSMTICAEEDIRAARRRAGEIAALVGFDANDQVRIATAVSEIARNAFLYAAGGRADFYLNAAEGLLTVRISDAGPGIPNLKKILRGQAREQSGSGMGIIGAQRLMDRFHIEQNPGRGCVVTLSKLLAEPGGWTPERLARLQAEAAGNGRAPSLDDMRHENQQLLQLSETLREREEHLARIRAELEDTNRGVMALYAELDEKAERLRRADQMKSRFLSHMSHEFRTPLTSIMALSRLLLDETDGTLTPEQHKQAGFIRKSAESLLEMVNDLLDLARVEAGKGVVRVSRFEVSNLFAVLRSLLRPLHLNPAVDLVFEDASALPALETDEAKVTQIVRNFISNALKFTEKGEVRITARLSGDGASVVFCVSDTGIGIEARHLEAIFQDFVQIENSLQQQWKGTGLGLSLSKGLAELLGGSVRAESSPGHGSRFFLDLPLVYKAAAEEERSGDAPDVLLIDDEEVSRYVIRQALGAGVRALEAEDGPAGLRLAKELHPRAIVLDLSMQPMNGFEVLDRLKADPATREIPVVILTAKTLSAIERDILGTRAAACISKEALSEPDAGERIRNAAGIGERQQHSAAVGSNLWLRSGQF